MAPSVVHVNFWNFTVSYLFVLLFFQDMLRAVAMNTTTGNAFRLAGLGGGILAGQAISPKADAGAGDTRKPREAWALKTGLYTPRQLVEGFAPLLDTVVFRLGQDPPNTRSSRAQLLDNLASNLNTTTREASLRLPQSGLDESRREIADQAQRIGKTLVQYARSYEGGPFNPDLYLRSPCEGHLLIPPNVGLMFGRRSQSHLMQLFNEYMHQMVLLRDALLPFQNFEDVIIPINGQATRGIRHLEPARQEFLTHVMTKQVSQASVIRQAQALLAPGLISQNIARKDQSLGYGFQYAYGVVLPAVLAGGETSLHLLRYLPTRLVQDTAKDVVFDYRIKDYYLEPRVEVPAGSGTAINNADGDVRKIKDSASPALHALSANIGIIPPSQSTMGATATRHLELQLEFNNGRCIAIDLGQVARGHRYAYQAASDYASTCGATSEPIAALGENNNDEVNDRSSLEVKFGSNCPIFHDVASILLETEPKGLVTAKNGGFHVIQVEDPIVCLAVLGKLYPENVVLLPRSNGLMEADMAGKELEPKFVIWGGTKSGGLRGVF